MTAFANLDGVVDAFSEAALDPSRWTKAMDAAALATGSLGAILFPLKGGFATLPQSDAMLRSTETYLRDGWVEADRRYLALPAMRRTGVGSDLDFISPDQMARDPYYNEFLRPHDLQWFAGVRVGVGDDAWVMSLQRTPAQGLFTPREIRSLRQLSHRLAGAERLARALEFSRLEGLALAFEASASPAVLIGRAGEALLANASAEQLFGPDLNVVQGRLASWNRAATAALNAALHPPVVLPRRAGRSIVAYPTRMPRIATDAFSRFQAIVVLCDLADKAQAPLDDIQKVFNLTQAEARLALRLAEGESLNEICDASDLAYETARNQLKAVFQKTGTHRQGELVALIGRLSRRRDATNRR